MTTTDSRRTKFDVLASGDSQEELVEIYRGGAGNRGDHGRSRSRQRCVADPKEGRRGKRQHAEMHDGASWSFFEKARGVA